MIIGFDIDGVLFPWTDVANEAVMEEFGVPDPGPHLTWQHLKHVLTKEQWGWLWSKEGQTRINSQAHRCFPVAVEAVNALLRLNHKVHFVTHRDPRLTAIYTTKFLELHFGRYPWAGVHVVGNGTRKAKLEHWDVFVDDKPETVFDVLFSSGNVKVFAPQRPWNMAELADFREGHRFVHYTDPGEIVEWVTTRTWR